MIPVRTEYKKSVNLYDPRIYFVQHQALRLFGLITQQLVSQPQQQEPLQPSLSYDG